MLLIAFGGRGSRGRLRAHAESSASPRASRSALVALAFVFNVDTRFQTARAGYTEAFQERVEQSDRAQRELAKLRRPARQLVAKTTPTTGSTAGLPDYGVAPALAPGRRLVQHASRSRCKQLRGKVVLIDFWTYSCINCLRTLPHLKAWDAAYRSRGPRDRRRPHAGVRVRARRRRTCATRSSGSGSSTRSSRTTTSATWDTYANQYWPAKYLIDRDGHVRYVHFGEGAYDETEALIRSCSARRRERDRRRRADARRGINTPESYLGYERLARYAGDAGASATGSRRTSFPKRSLPLDELAYGGKWRVEARAHRRRRGREAAPALPRERRLPRPRRQGRRRACWSTAARRRPCSVDGYRLYTLRDSPKRRERRAARAALLARRAGVRVHVRRLEPRALRALVAGDRAVVAVVLLALAQEARQLGRERVARREVRSRPRSRRRGSRAPRRRPPCPRPPPPPRSPAPCRASLCALEVARVERDLDQRRRAGRRAPSPPGGDGVIET